MTLNTSWKILHGSGYRNTGFEPPYHFYCGEWLVSQVIQTTTQFLFLLVFFCFFWCQTTVRAAQFTVTASVARADLSVTYTHKVLRTWILKDNVFPSRLGNCSKCLCRVIQQSVGCLRQANSIFGLPVYQHNSTITCSDVDWLHCACTRHLLLLYQRCPSIFLSHHYGMKRQRLLAAAQ